MWIRILVMAFGKKTTCSQCTACGAVFIAAVFFLDGLKSVMSVTIQMMAVCLSRLSVNRVQITGRMD